jgi:hypothetical protein
MPLPLTTLLARNPAMAPTMIQITIPIRLNLQSCLAAVIRKAVAIETGIRRKCSPAAGY